MQVQSSRGPDRMTPDERKARVAELTKVIATHIESAEMAFVALEEVHSLKLYRDAGFTSFEAYVRENFGRSRQWAYELMERRETIAKLSAAVPERHTVVPMTRADVRAVKNLAKKDPEAARQELTERIKERTVREWTPPAQTAPAIAHVEPSTRWVRLARDLTQELQSPAAIASIAILAEDEDGMERACAILAELRGALEQLSEALDTGALRSGPDDWGV